VLTRPTISFVKPARFDYHDPHSFEETVELLAAAGPDAKVMAGGQSLMPLMNMRLVRPAVVVDINRVQDAGYVKPWQGGAAFGATARLRSLEWDPLIGERLPVLKMAARHIGHTQIRSRGTVCGSIAHADPAAELPALALALDGEMEVQSSRGKRTLAATDFYVDYLTTSLEPDEVLVETRFPGPPDGMAWAFLEISRRHGDFAMVGIVAGLALDAEGKAVTDARLTYFGVGGTPIRCREVEASLRGQPASDETFASAGAAVQPLLDPSDDVHATAPYRRSVAGVLTQRALNQAWRQLRGES
jgi:aerobic carbon-monoxide dehydrogenase medium subunit